MGRLWLANNGDPCDDGSQAQQIKLYKQALRKHHMTGDVDTQATIIEDEQNGLIDAASGESKVPAGLLHSNNVCDNFIDILLG